MAETAATLPVAPKVLLGDGLTLHFCRLLPGDPAAEIVPSYHFRIFSGDESLGHINLRFGTTAHVEFCAGHIGFEIWESCRGRRCALRACHALAPFARSISPEQIITCDPENHASRRTIEFLGARFLGESVVPPHDPHFLRGSRIKRRYLWNP